MYLNDFIFFRIEILHENLAMTTSNATFYAYIIVNKPGKDDDYLEYVQKAEVLLSRKALKHHHIDWVHMAW